MERNKINRGIVIVILSIVMVSLVATQVAFAKEGDPIGDYKEITAYSNGGNFNTHWQCVEYIKRFYAGAMGVDTSGWYGNAWTYYGQASSRGLEAYPNGGFVPPAPGDILVYGKGNTIDTQYGHVAIVMAVHSNSVEVIEQNVDPKNPYRTIIKSGNTLPRWSGLPVTGWVHKGPLVEVAYPRTGTYWSKNRYKTVTWKHRTDLGMNAANIDLVSTSGKVISIAKNVSLKSSGTSSYSWLVTQPTGRYKVRITLLKKYTSGPEYTTESGIFYIG